MRLATTVGRLLGSDDVTELTGGHQSRVFRVVDRAGESTIAKVHDPALIDPVLLGMRTGLTVAVADLEPAVCRPLPVDGELVTEIRFDDADGLLVRFEEATGVAPDPADPADAHALGAALARLHRAMAQVPTQALPTVAAAPPDQRHQLLHGDFHAGNVRRSGSDLRIFDFDDCGYGPPSADVANALYLVMFDAVMFDARMAATPDTYRTFRSAFVAGYSTESGQALDATDLDRAIDRRVDALRGWLDDLASAPVGVRTASPAWHATLRTFVDGHRPL